MSEVVCSSSSILWESMQTNIGIQSQQPLMTSSRRDIGIGNESPLPNPGNCFLSCSHVGTRKLRRSTQIGYPTNVSHNIHVTLNRFLGLRGLPEEVELQVLRNFGVSGEFMQFSQDWRGNRVPTILLEMQKCLYEQNGLKNEGIFRISAENTQAAYLRLQLNQGIVLDDIEPYCLAALIKAWFRELPRGVMDALTPRQVMQAQTEDECAHLMELFPNMDASLLNWAINLMADVVEEEDRNKMNAHNVAVVFASNMTRMGDSLLADPSTALTYVGELVNFLKILILKTLKERKAALPVLEPNPAPGPEPRHENGDQCSSLSCDKEEAAEENDKEKYHKALTDFESPCHCTQDDPTLLKSAFRFHSDNLPFIVNQSFHITKTGNPKAPYIFTRRVHLTRTLCPQDLVDLKF